MYDDAIVLFVGQNASDDKTRVDGSQSPSVVCAVRGVLRRRYYHHRVSALM